MGSVSDCFDNALAERFFATLKTELIYTRAWPSRHEMEMEVFSYIEGFYNPRRRHSRLRNVSPATDEMCHLQRRPSPGSGRQGVSRGHQPGTARR
jgi:putative transposase